MSKTMMVNSEGVVTEVVSLGERIRRMLERNRLLRSVANDQVRINRVHWPDHDDGDEGRGLAGGKGVL